MIPMTRQRKFEITHARAALRLEFTRWSGRRRGRLFLAMWLFLICLAPAARADVLRNLKPGEPIPPFRLVTIDGELIDGESSRGSVLVMVYLAAEQRSSELAAIDARIVVEQVKEAARAADDMWAPPPDGVEAAGAAVPVELLYVTADVVRRAYFDRVRKERSLEAPLALDPDRSLYGKLGLIVFPTTIIVDREGKLAHVISLHNPDYKHVLESNIRHALELIDDEQLRERLKARPTGVGPGSPKRMAAAHRALARQLRETGRLDAARDELLKSRELDPDNADVLLDLADLDVAIAGAGGANNLQEAQGLIEHVLRENAGHRRAKQIGGIILYRQGRLVEAESILIDALNLNPDPARIHYYLGRIYEQQGQPARALEHYRRALQRFLNETELATPSPQ
jgi:tetratricopeptide (TPR) repeat protein